MTPKQSLATAWANALQPDPVITADEWARTERVMPADAVEPGPYRPERTPYMIDVQRTMSATSPWVEGWMKKGVQLGGSVSGENLLGSWICNAAGNILVSFPKLEDAKQWELTRFEPMRLSSRALRKRIKSAGVKGSDNTKLRKKYPGGVMRLIGVSSMPKSATVRYVKVEEADEYPFDVDNQGSIFEGLRARFRNFGRKAKMFGDSTPTVDGASNIDREYKRGDQRKWHLCCPDCQHPQPLRWAQMKWIVHEDPEETAASTRYACESCGTLNSEAAWKTANYARRPGMTEAQCKAANLAFWEATAKGQPGVASWHISSLAAPIGWAPWGSLALMWLGVGDDEDKKKAFSNNVEGETYSYKVSSAISAKMLQSLSESYALMSCPMGGLVCVAGVDTQDNRLAYVIRAYGRQEESWGLAHGEIYGDTSQPEVWKKLAEVLDAPIAHSCGQVMRVDVAFIDMGGHRGEEVKAFCRDARLHGKHWCATLGAKPLHAPPLGKPRKVDFTWRGKEVPGGAEFRYIGTQTIKNMLDGRLKLGTEANAVRSGAGVFHTPIGFEQDYFDQMRSEQRILHKDNSGNKVMMWVHLSGRNEAWDCEVLCYAAYLYVIQGRHAETVFGQREKLYQEARQGDLLAPQITPPNPVVHTSAPETTDAATSAPESISIPQPAPVTVPVSKIRPVQAYRPARQHHQPVRTW
ncbi:MAG: terminase gpA endonuclease subunit [Rhodoferax sp.]